MNDDTETAETSTIDYGPSAEVMKDLKAKYPRCELVFHPDLKQAVVIRPVDRANYKRFRLQSHEPEKRYAATENLVKACVVWPEKAVLDAQLDDYAAIMEVWGSEILRLSGLAAGSDIEKKAL